MQEGGLNAQSVTEGKRKEGMKSRKKSTTRRGKSAKRAENNPTAAEAKSGGKALHD